MQILIWRGEFSGRYTDPLQIEKQQLFTEIRGLYFIQLGEKYSEPAHPTVLLLDPNLAGEFSARYTDLVHIVTITPAKILMHPRMAPNGAMPRASRGVHTKEDRNTNLDKITKFQATKVFSPGNIVMGLKKLSKR